MKYTKKTIIFAMLAILLVSCGSINQKRSSMGKSNDRILEAEELKRDFGQMRSILERDAIGLFSDKAKLTTLLDGISSQLEQPLTEIQFYRMLTPAVAALRCGHSFLSISEDAEVYLRNEALFFPLDIRIFGEDLFVIGDPFRTGVIPGTQILSVNGMSSRDIISRICGSMSTDGRDLGRPRYDAERWFASMYYTYIDSPDSFDLGINPPGSETASTVRVPAVRDSSRAKTAKGISHDTLGMPYSRSFHDGYAILKIPNFSYPNMKAYGDFLKEFFSETVTRRIGTLILDLRGNYGGSPTPTMELFKYIIAKPIPFFSQENPFYLAPWKKPIKPSALAFGGKLFVLMDEAGSSMNGFLLSLLKYHGIGTLVGAQSAGGYECSDASRDAVLRNSGLRIRYSTQVFRTAVTNQESGIGVEPDIRVDWTLDDYLSGRDPVLDAALSEALQTSRACIDPDARPAKHPVHFLHDKERICSQQTWNLIIRSEL